MPVTLHINGRSRRLDVPSGATLLEAIRDYAGLTGTKYGCGEGQCGACTVLMDGRAVQSCLIPATAATGKIITIEGLANGSGLHLVQQAFLDVAAFQCAFCTPGMIMGSVALLQENRNPSVGEVRDALNGHVCRCGAHPRIVEAVRLAASRVNKEGRP